MAKQTSSFGFMTPEASDLISDSLGHLGSNFEQIDGMPLPTEYGSNSQMEYFKFNNGILLMWGCLNHGLSMPCTLQWGFGFASADFDIFWPVPLVAPNNAAIIVQGRAPYNPDLLALQRSIDASKGTFCYNFPAWSETNISKQFNIFVIGRWK